MNAIVPTLLVRNEFELLSMWEIQERSRRNDHSIGKRDQDSDSNWFECIVPNIPSVYREHKSTSNKGKKKVIYFIKNE